MTIPRALLLVLVTLSTACQTTQSTQPAQAPELPLTARGQEPGWILEMGRDKLNLEYQYGQKSFSAPTPEPQSISNGVRYFATNNNQSLRLELQRRYCTDVMSGMPYPYTAQVTIDGEILEGCGGEAQRLLTGPEWRVTTIEGEAVKEESRLTLHFTEDGKVHGRAGCNLYSGRYQITGEGITVGSLSQTRMACAPSVMKQEEDLLNVLRSARRFRIDASEALIIEGVDNQSLKAERP